MFDQIAIETRRTPPDPEQAGVFLAHKAVEAGLARFADLDEIAAFQSRVRVRGAARPVAPLDDAAIEAALASLATGLKSFAELEAAARGGGLLRAMEQQMPPGTRRLLDEIAPGRHPAAARPPGAGSLRAEPAALDRFAPAGFLRHARDAHGGARRGPAWWCVCWRPISVRCR